MRRYETIVILDPDLSENDRNQRTERIKEIIPSFKGDIIELDEWGNRKLAYEIRKKIRGHYIRIDYCGDGPLVNELERTFRLDDKFLKYMTIILDTNTDPEAVRAELSSKQEAAEAETEAEVPPPVNTEDETSDADLEEPTEETNDSEEEI